jgi:hypothetical protein
MGVVVIALAAGVAAAVYYSWTGRDPSPEQQLERLCRGDAAQAGRLIAHEQRRMPRLSRAQAAARAVEFYRRDNA